MHLLAERFAFLGGDDWGFLKGAVKTYLLTPKSILPQFANYFSVFTSVVYGLSRPKTVDCLGTRSLLILSCIQNFLKVTVTRPQLVLEAVEGRASQ